MGWMGLDENSSSLWPSILSHRRQPPASRAPGPDQALQYAYLRGARLRRVGNAPGRAATKRSRWGGCGKPLSTDLAVDLMSSADQPPNNGGCFSRIRSFDSSADCTRLQAPLEAYLASYGGLQRAPEQISGKFRRQRPP